MISVIKSSLRSYSSERWAPLFLVASAFAVPISSTAKSIFIPLAILSILCVPKNRRELAGMIYFPWCQAALLLFFIVSLACFWSPATTHEKMMFVGKYSKLLYLPILVLGFRDPKVRAASLSAFLVAMVITCLVSILKYAHLIKFNGDDPGNVFHTHIITSYMMAFATYLSALFVIRQTGKARILYASLFVLFSYQILFLSLGRTGYVIYILLMCLLIVQTLSWRKAALALLVGCSLFAVIYSNSSTMQIGIKQAVVDWRDYQEKISDATPIGHRLQFQAFAKDLFLRHPWIGCGTGSYTYSFDQENPVPSWSGALLEPHSQYWLVACEFGVLGVLALLFFFGSLFHASWQLQSMRVIAIAMLLPFVVGNVSDSLLFYSGSGVFFILFMALCLGEQRSRTS